MRTSLFLSLLFIVAVGEGAQSCGAKHKGNDAATQVNANNGTQSTPPPTPAGTPSAVELKVLAEGQYGKADQAFVAVVRDPKTYAALAELAGELPKIDAGQFETHAVVAAFLGYRNTGGYAVSVTAQAGNVLRVAEKSPPKDAILAQVITNPFVIVAVPVGEQASVWLELDDNWNRGMRAYEVVEGEFTMSGGIAGMWKSSDWEETCAYQGWRAFRPSF